MGLDEIEAGLAEGGGDIEQRSASLAESDQGLQDVSSETEQAEAANAQTRTHAEQNVADADLIAEEATELLAALQAHETSLAQEEELGQAYVQGFASQHAAWFDRQDTPAQAAPDELASPEQTLSEAEVAPVRAMLLGLVDAEGAAEGEVQEVAQRSGAVVPEEAAAEEAALHASAWGAYRGGQSTRAAEITGLLGQCDGLIGAPVEVGRAQLETLMNTCLDLAGRLEQSRSEALSAFVSFHQGIDDAPEEA